MSLVEVWSESGVIIKNGQAKLVKRGLYSWATTSATGAIPVPMRQVEDVRTQSIAVGGTASMTDQVSSPTISASATLRFTATRAGSISAAGFIVGTTVSTATDNYWSGGIINKGAAGSGTAVVADIANAANSSNTTGGAAFTANVLRAFTLTSTAADLVVAAGDILEITLTKTASGANLVTPTFVWTQTTAGTYQEEVYWSDTLGADGKLLLSSSADQKINLARSSISPVSGRKVFVEITGVG